MGSHKVLFNPNKDKNLSFISTSKSKLWVNIPQNPKPRDTQTAVRPTVTTLLRHHQIVKKQEKAEKEKVQGFIQGNSDFDYDFWRQNKDAEELKHNQHEEAKRILKSKLAYHKAIAAAKEIANQKSEIADNVRNEARRLKEELETERQLDLERRRVLALEIQSDLTHSRKLLKELQQKKRLQAQEFKEQTKKLQEEARLREKEDMSSRKEKIQQIQASKLALKAANAGVGNLSFVSTAGFIGAIGSPETEIRLKLTREREQAELEERQRKVKAAKEEKERKFREVRDKLEGHVKKVVGKKELQNKFKNLPEFRHPEDDIFVEDEEISELTKELKKYQIRRPSSNSNVQKYQYQAQPEYINFYQAGNSLDRIFFNHFRN